VDKRLLELISWFVKSCWDINPAAHAVDLLQRYFNKLYNPEFDGICINKE
jgi:hypothetical protein